MSMMSDLKKGYGLDDNGVIVSDVSIEKINCIFKPCIQETLGRLKAIFEDDLHSVYLYGRVARGDATPIKSDLDVIAIFKNPLNEDRRTQLQKLQGEQSKKFRHLVREVGIAHDHLDAVMEESKYYENAFLKELSVCLFGDDLRRNLGPYQLTTDIPISFNGDITKFYNKVLAQLETAQGETLNKLTGKICRKLIRTFYSMVMVRAQIWTTKLHEQKEVFLYYFPEKKSAVQTLLHWLDEPPRDKREVYELFEKEGKWASTNFKEEVMKT